MTYGIAYLTGPDTIIIECADLRDAWAQAVALSVDQDVDIVELDGSGPALDSDGDEIAPTHAPRRTISSLPYVSDARIERLQQECGEAGDAEGVRITRAAMADDRAARLECARMMADAIAAQCSMVAEG